MDGKTSLKKPSLPPRHKVKSNHFQYTLLPETRTQPARLGRTEENKGSCCQAVACEVPKVGALN